jgi:hydroxymethylpyrimidine/phosphomethylpyrimidine kinase
MQLSQTTKSDRPAGRFTPIVVDALYPGVERGLAADLAAARALGGPAFPVCTMLLMAGNGTVTDATDVPVDTVRAQLEHLTALMESAEARATGVMIGVLATHGAAEAVLAFAERFEGPVVLDLQLSGPSGETVLTGRGIETVMARLNIPDVVIVGRSDAQPISGGEIHSLDDAQVAAQRLVKRGARAVVIKCGALPARFFETEGIDSPDAGSGSDVPFNADLYFDGESFALFEAPHIEGGSKNGASSAFALAVLRALCDGAPPEAALQEAKRYVTEGLRASGQQPDASFNFSWGG